MFRRLDFVFDHLFSLELSQSHSAFGRGDGFERTSIVCLELLKLIAFPKRPSRSIHHDPLISQYPFHQCQNH